MNSRFSLPVTALALSLAVVLGSALLAVLSAGSSISATAPLSTYIRPIVVLLAAGALAGAAAWAVLFAMKRDGYHRMEWVAFLPFNYGGRSAFDTSPFPKR